MKIKIHRGSHEIGGTCVELTALSGKTLWIDLGLPLSDKNPDISYAQGKDIDGLLISHPHQDHYGLMDFMNKETSVYIGRVSLDLINATKIFLNKPLEDRNFEIITPWKWFLAAGSFRVKPYLVDHSSPEAFAFLIEVDGKRVFYSGDFRATGNKRILYDNLVKRPPRDIDLLLVEGTMVGRNNSEYQTENEVKEAIYQVVKKQENVSFVVSSAQNIDRFVSVFKACQKTGKQVVVDVYNAWVLEKVKKKSPGLPTAAWKEVLVYNNLSQMDKINAAGFEDFRALVKKKSIENKVFSNPADYVYFLRCPSIKLIDALRKHGKINLIYSQWQGYLREEHKKYFTDIINKLKKDHGIDYKEIHTSGHATLKELKELAQAINPIKIVPIHTEKPKEFKVEFEKDRFDNVCLWDDGKEYDL